MLLLDFAWRSTVFLAGAWLITSLLMRRSSAARRHLVWLAALAALALLPLLRPLRRWNPLPAPAVAAGPTPRVPRIARTVIDVTATDPRATDLLLILWLAGAALLLGRAAHGQLLAWITAQRAKPFAEGVVLSGEIKVPMVCGLTRPVVVLPAGAADWHPERRDAAIAHEREHVRRRDTLSQALAQAACAFYWPQPLVWLAASALRRECEQAADDGVLAHLGTPASSYAGHLVEIARTLAHPGARGAAAPAGGIAMTRTTQLHRRVAALLDPHTDRRAAGARFARLLLSAASVTALAVATLPELALGQSPGSLSGVVRDPSGGVIPKARIDLRAPGVREVAYSNAAGEFAFEKLADGAYEITVATPGFARMTQSGVRFESASPRKLELVLQIGSLSEKMTVEATTNAPALASTTAPAGGPPQRIRVGGNVQAAKLIEKVRPEYPVSAKIDGVMGTVLLMAVIGRDGTIVNLEPINKQVDARLVESAMNAVRKWRYSPTLLNGMPVEVVTEVEVNYTLTR